MRFTLLSVVVLLALVLSGCIYNKRPRSSADLAYETWQRDVDTNSNKWLQGADRWFVTGGVNGAEETDRGAPATAAISTMMVQVPNCLTYIKVNGHFRVQIFGTDGNNSLYVYGPNTAVRAVAIRVTENTLYLNQAKNAPSNMDCVIVRIGIRQLHHLGQMGAGLIEARNIRSSDLCISSSGRGNIYLSGGVNLTKVTATGCGSVTVFGAVTPELAISTAGSATVNVSGNVGIQAITHHGSGNINIIGANSDGLMIHADGHGKIGVNGRVDVREIDAKGHVCVYVCYVNGQLMKVNTSGSARVGLAGCMRVMNVNTGKGSRFEGHYLYTEDAYVRAHDFGHINVTASNKIFAAATQSGSVYFFGSPNTLTQFYRENGVVVPILSTRPRAMASGGYCPYYKRSPQLNYKDQS